MPGPRRPAAAGGAARARRQCGAATRGRPRRARASGRSGAPQVVTCTLQVGATVEWNRPADKPGTVPGRGTARRLCRCNGRSRMGDGGGVRRNGGDSERLCVLAIGQATAAYRFDQRFFDGGVALGVARFLQTRWIVEYLSSTPRSSSQPLEDHWGSAGGGRSRQVRLLDPSAGHNQTRHRSRRARG